MKSIVVVTVVASVTTGAFAGWGNFGKAAAGVGAKTAIKAVTAAQEQKQRERQAKEDERQRRAKEERQRVVTEQQKKVEEERAAAKRAEQGAAAKAAEEQTQKVKEEPLKKLAVVTPSPRQHLSDPNSTFTAAWMMWDEYKELSDADKKEFVAEAEKRAADVKDSAIVFEGFYAGMPLIDFIAISEQKKVFQKWEKMLSGSSRWHYAEISDAKDLASRYVITMMIFEGRDWSKLIDCEDDSEVLDQFVHQYVLKKKGKASPLTTLGKAKFEGPDSYDRRWKTYKSTKYGMSVAWCKDESFLRLMKLGDD